MLLTNETSRTQHPMVPLISARAYHGVKHHVTFCSFWTFPITFLRYNIFGGKVKACLYPLQALRNNQT